MITDSETDVAWSLYPNPAKEKITVTLGTISVTGMDLMIIDAVGHVLVRDNVFTTRTVDITQLNAGVYVLQLTGANGIASQKLFVKTD